ncbi:hypothetical protein [Paenibacillus protaetiae]|uniref:hypothetical protein n=1 Tax=Paenibacillus protaetiae TaxID=2509456 RepID=UPI0013EB563E|nr:hypothetical protein [Paenibacillus protaetiae]
MSSSNKPVYYDGSGQFQLHASNPQPVPEVTVPRETAIDNKPVYYDGSGHLQFLNNKQ